MTDKSKLTTIWLSPHTYRELLQVENVFITKNDCTVNPDDVVKELIKFWKKHQS